jgi:hypothetical protein
LDKIPARATGSAQETNRETDALGIFFPTERPKKQGRAPRFNAIGNSNPSNAVVLTAKFWKDVSPLMRETSKFFESRPGVEKNFDREFLGTHWV